MSGGPVKNRRHGDGRPAFTLVELLVTITIIALLSAIVLFGMAGIQEEARARRARSQVARLHELIAEKWRSYEFRRVPTQPNYDNQLNGVIDNRFGLGTNGMDRDGFIRSGLARLEARRELLRMELPERITDVKDPPVVLGVNPALWNAYNQRVASVWGVDWGNKDHQADPDTWSINHQGAECLYMIVSMLYVNDANGLEFFAASEIGDTDNDRMPEFIDPWGNPIEFLRWAPGFTSPAIGSLPGGTSTLQESSPLDGWDTFDPLRIDGDRLPFRPQNEDLTMHPNCNFTIFPLIYSAGPDGEPNIFAIRKASTTDSTWDPIRYVETVNISGFYNDPYAVFGNDQVRLGQVADPQDKGHLDNITNHLLEAP